MESGERKGKGSNRTPNHGAEPEPPFIPFTSDTPPATDNPQVSTLFLVGFMGSGKTTVGRCLAERRGVEFIDLDERIVFLAGRSIADIFAQAGEAEFRRLEHQVLSDLCGSSDGAEKIVALGGGAFCFPANREVMAKVGIAVWLDVPFETCAARCADDGSRPLFRNPESVRALHDGRRTDYAHAQIRIDAEGKSAESVAAEILSSLGKPECPPPPHTLQIPGRRNPT